MKMLNLLVPCLGLALIGGCATYDPSRVDDLEHRVVRLEKKLGTTPETLSETAGTGTGAAVTAAGEGTGKTQIVVPDTPSKKDIQQTLKNAGYYTGEVDGKFGPQTEKAVKDFQDANNLVVDGKVGVNTWDKMRTFYSPPEE
jgi:murein L,D-transpeptidase YcbB/YkuD